MKKTVIGLVGPIASGKGVVAQFLKNKGFVHFSLSDRIREECSKRKILIDRQSLQDVADQLRKKHGDEELAKRTISLVEKNKSNLIVIESIRHPQEIKLLKQKLNAYILGINASRKKRFNYLKGRKNRNDPQIWEDFLKADLRETVKQKKHSQQVTKSLELADKVILNNSSLESLERKIKKLLLTLKIKG